VPGAECAGVIEVLADRPLRRLELVVADRSVIRQRVGHHMIEGLRLGDVTAAAASAPDRPTEVDGVAAGYRAAYCTHGAADRRAKQRAAAGYSRNRRTPACAD
jgi:hypothetical protein